MAFHPLSLILLTENQLPLYREYSSHQTRIHLISFFTQTNLHLYPSLSLSFCLRPTSSLMSLIPSSSTPQGHLPSVITYIFNLPLFTGCSSSFPLHSVSLQTTTLILLIPDSHFLPRAL